MKNTFLRSKYNIKKIILYYFLALLPLIIAGFYKNGIKLYANHLVSLKGLFMPIIFDLLGFLIGCLVNIIYEKIIKKNKMNLIDTIFSSFHPIYGLLIASIISINTSVYLFILITFISLLISKFIKKSKINIVALTALIIICIINLIGDFSFLNIYEQQNNLSLVAIDYLTGKGSGGINTTHVLLLAFSLIILCNTKFYKREIPLYSTIIFSSCIILYCIFTNDVGRILNNIFSNGILFSFIFVATDPMSSSYTNKGEVVYSLIIGITTFLLFFVYPPLSALGGIILASLCHDTLDKIVQR